MHELPIDIQERVQARLHQGAYASEDDVLRDAMDALDQMEEEKLTRWNEQNRLSEAQSAAGLSEPLDDQKVLARLRQRLANEGIVG